MADTNTNILQTLKINDKLYRFKNCWEQLGLSQIYMLALLSRDEYTPVATHQPTETDTLYIDPASGNSASFHPGQCVTYPDNEMPDGWGLSIAKQVIVNAQGIPTKVFWHHATDVEKRLSKMEEIYLITHQGAFGTGLWVNEYPWQLDAVWDNGI